MPTRRAPSNTDLPRWSEIAHSLRDKAYRDAFIEQEIMIGIPFQIRALRKERGWSQKKLGELARKPGDAAGTAQETISLWEKPGYGRLTISTLIRLASAFDVGLMVRFASYSDLVDRAANLSSASIAVPSYKDDSRLHSDSGDSVIADMDSDSTHVPILSFADLTGPISSLTQAVMMTAPGSIGRHAVTSVDTIAERENAPAA
jgi:transcriptional regulator with XRE-family HTH domain